MAQHCIGNFERINFGMIDLPFQVLPLATEVVRWFDMKPLEILWDNYLSREHTLLCYGGCIALRYSILHAGRLMHFLEQPPPSWKVRFLFCTAFVFVYWSVMLPGARINTQLFTCTCTVQFA